MMKIATIQTPIIKKNKINNSNKLNKGGGPRDNNNNNNNNKSRKDNFKISTKWKNTELIRNRISKAFK